MIRYIGIYNTYLYTYLYMIRYIGIYNSVYIDIHQNVCMLKYLPMMNRKGGGVAGGGKHEIHHQIPSSGDSQNATFGFYGEVSPGSTNTV